MRVKSGSRLARRISLLVAVDTAAVFIVLMTACPTWGNTANQPPVADAGLPCYAAKDPIRLDGSGSYDPDHSGPLSYAWTQVSGPPLVTTGANTATPLISGPNQTGGQGNTIAAPLCRRRPFKNASFSWSSAMAN